MSPVKVNCDNGKEYVVNMPSIPAVGEMINIRGREYEVVQRRYNADRDEGPEICWCEMFVRASDVSAAERVIEERAK